MIRCDDIFVDSDVDQFGKICRIIRQYEFDHLIGVTLLGEGKRLWAREKSNFWKIPLTSFAANYRLKHICGEKKIGENVHLLNLLDIEFRKFSALPALHGLHHYNYARMPNRQVLAELTKGINLLKELLGVSARIFVPPFNAWNRNTEIICEKLSLSIDKCEVGFDGLIDNMNTSEIEQLAKQQSFYPEVHYHPYRISNLEKFELYVKSRRKYI